MRVHVWRNDETGEVIMLDVEDSGADVVRVGKLVPVTNPPEVVGGKLVVMFARDHEYVVGDTVLMKPIPEESDEPQEQLILLGFDAMPWGVSATGQVPVNLRAPDDPDGIRKFTPDQIERKL